MSASFGSIGIQLMADMLKNPAPRDFLVVEYAEKVLFGRRALFPDHHFYLDTIYNPYD
ncbi:MAG TPA: hypothetical protein VFQ72_03710 [Candidatus Paceibacterota bacterium]|nr:hypothetical protein [Candidatus Paceibacterota bacterium]